MSRLKKADIVMNDYYLGEKTFEMAEVKMQKCVFDKVLKNIDRKINNIK